MNVKHLLGIVLGGGIALALGNLLISAGFVASPVIVEALPLREALWNYRTLDVLGQLALLLSATYGVLVLIKERD